MQFDDHNAFLMAAVSIHLEEFDKALSDVVTGY